MESILRDVGATIESESLVQRDAIRQKIFRSIKFGNPLDFPIVDDIPQLSAKSMEKMSAKLKDEVISQKSAISVLKFRFFQNIVKLSNMKFMKEKVILDNKDEKISNIRMNDKNDVEKKSLMPSLPYESSFSPSDRLLISEERIQQMNRNIQQLHDSIMQPASTIPCGPNDEKIIGKKKKRRIETADLVKVKNNDKRSKKMDEKESPSASKSRDKASRKEVKSATPAEVNMTYECPICMTQLDIGGSFNPERMISSHVDRCIRRQSSTSSNRRNITCSSSTPDPTMVVERRKSYVYDDLDDEELSSSSESGDDISVGSFCDEEKAKANNNMEGNKSSEFSSDESLSDEEVGETNTREGLHTISNSRNSAVSRDKSGRVRVSKNNSNTLDDWNDKSYVARLERQANIEHIVINENVNNDVYSIENEDNLMNLKAVSNIITTEFGTEVPSSIWNGELYPYQRDGVKWLWGLYSSGYGAGGILGDEMGLGKTAQLCVHFSSIAKYELKRKMNQDSRIMYPTFLIVCPATVLQHWMRELNHWAPTLRVVILHSLVSSFSQLKSKGMSHLTHAIKEKFTGKSASNGIVGIATYSGIRDLQKILLNLSWTAVCLDEGQKIKSPEVEITAICKCIPSAHRIILSGTPIQNSLKELWSLFDFIHPGRLGTLASFELEFCDPIRIGGYSTATQLQSEIAVRTAKILQSAIRPFLLRRRKTDLEVSLSLPKKTEQVLFCRLSQKQRQIYEDIISSNVVTSSVRRKTPSLSAIVTLRKLCNHPILAFHKGRVKWARVGSKSDVRSDSDEDVYRGSLSVTENNSILPLDDINWYDSGKLLVLSKILPLWKMEGHKVLVFCQTQSMISLIEIMLKELNVNYFRLDGSTPVHKRDDMVSQFNANEDIFLMVATTKTGGVGISLTAANKVVLMDPDWNPQTDIQARERAWRLGQKREVTIFRLITKGTIEEKIYQRQIYKLLLTNRILDNPHQKRLFSKSEISELFELGSDHVANDLPYDGEIDMEVDSSHTTNVHQEDTSNNETGFDIDKKLLKALFDGDAVTNVYDHGYFENNGDNSNSSAKMSQIQELAKKSVDEAVKQLKLSVQSRQSNNNTEDTTKKVYVPNSMAPPSASASTMLTGLRKLNQKNNNSQSSNQATDTDGNNNVNILSRLHKLFQRSRKLQTADIVKSFEDLPDSFAPVFREMLRRIAVFKDGYWEYIGEVEV